MQGYSVIALLLICSLACFSPAQSSKAQSLKASWQPAEVFACPGNAPQCPTHASPIDVAYSATLEEYSYLRCEIQYYLTKFGLANIISCGRQFFLEDVERFDENADLAAGSWLIVWPGSEGASRLAKIIRYMEIGILLPGGRKSEDLQAFLKSANSSVRMGGEERNVYMEDASAGDGVQQIDLCYRKIIFSLVGPPQLCTPIALITPIGSFLRGEVELTWSAAQGGDLASSQETMSASFRTFGGASIDISFDIATGEPVGKFVDVTKSGLTRMGMVFDIDDSEKDFILIKSASEIRNSVWLKDGSREAIDLDIVITKGSDDMVRFRASARPVVADFNSGNLAAYHVPSDVQQQVYAREFDGAFLADLSSACLSVTVIDSGKLKCQ